MHSHDDLSDDQLRELAWRIVLDDAALAESGPERVAPDARKMATDPRLCRYVAEAAELLTTLDSDPFARFVRESTADQTVVDQPGRALARWSAWGAAVAVSLIVLAGGLLWHASQRESQEFGTGVLSSVPSESVDRWEQQLVSEIDAEPVGADPSWHDPLNDEEAGSTGAKTWIAVAVAGLSEKSEHLE